MRTYLEKNYSLTDGKRLATVGKVRVMPTSMIETLKRNLCGVLYACWLKQQYKCAMPVDYGRRLESSHSLLYFAPQAHPDQPMERQQ